MGVFKLYGNIGNHFLDCTWFSCNYGVFAQGSQVAEMHSGCDRYSGGHINRCSIAGLYYDDDIGGGGQIIVDGTILEGNAGWAIRLQRTGDARMTWNAICIRNVWFEGNIAGDISFEGVRSVRIDDSRVSKFQLIESSVNLYNCRCDYDAGMDPDHLIVDSKSSIVAYEHRYMSYPSDKIFVNSISYDGTEDINHERWQPTSVWGPLRVVKPTIFNYYLISEQFDTNSEPFQDLQGGPDIDTLVTPFPHVLGKGSGWIIMAANNLHIRSRNIIVTTIDRPKYFVWSIHTYLQSENPENEVYGQIVNWDGSLALGRIYFKHNQWVCSYGMKLVTTKDPLYLEFKTLNAAANFFITDYQVVMFDDLYSANSFVNSRAFAKHVTDKERGNFAP